MASPPPAGAQDFPSICNGVRVTGANCDAPNDTQAEDALNRTIVNGLRIFSAIVGVVAVAMMIYGGFRYVTAGGDSSRISQAQQTIIYAIVGLVVAALAQVIAQFVLAQAT